MATIVDTAKFAFTMKVLFTGNHASTACVHVIVEVTGLVDGAVVVVVVWTVVDGATVVETIDVVESSEGQSDSWVAWGATTASIATIGNPAIIRDRPWRRVLLLTWIPTRRTAAPNNTKEATLEPDWGNATQGSIGPR